MIDVVEQGVALEERHELELVAPGEVRRAIADRVGAFLISHLQRRRHPLPRFDVPRAGRGRRDACDPPEFLDRKSTRLNSSHVRISYAVFCLKKKNKNEMYFS